MEEPRDVAISGLLLLSALFNNQRLATQAQRKASAFASSPDVATTTGQYFYKCLPTTPSALHAIVAVVTQLGIGRHEGK